MSERFKMGFSGPPEKYYKSKTLLTRLYWWLFQITDDMADFFSEWSHSWFVKFEESYEAHLKQSCTPSGTNCPETAGNIPDRVRGDEK